MNRVKQQLRLLHNFIFRNRSKTLTVRIVLRAAFYRLCILVIPMKILEKHFGETGKESEEVDTVDNMNYAIWLGRRIERICDKTMWDSKCLARALVAQKLLAKKRIHTTLYLGLKKEQGKMVAHAWLRCGISYVTGGTGSDYVKVACFYR